MKHRGILRQVGGVVAAFFVWMLGLALAVFMGYQPGPFAPPSALDVVGKLVMIALILGAGCGSGYLCRRIAGPGPAPAILALLLAGVIYIGIYPLQTMIQQWPGWLLMAAVVAVTLIGAKESSLRPVVGTQSATPP